MLCFLDRTFCGSKNCKNKCGRQWTKELQKRADQWARESGFLGDPPVAFCNFCDDTEELKDAN
jgi:hypothetical protein